MQIKHEQTPITGIKMDNEIKEPFVERPDFSEPNKPAYDHRNYECAGKYRGVGEAGKVGKKNPSSIEPMPPEKKKMKVPRDHEG